MRNFYVYEFICFFACVSFYHLNALKPEGNPFVVATSESIAILAKDIEIGVNPVTGKKCIAKGYAFVDKTKAKSDSNSVWYSVIRDTKNEKDLLFVVFNGADAISFPVTEFITKMQSKVAFFDPKNPQLLIEKPNDKEKGSLIQIKILVDQEVQLFKDLIIALAQRNTQAIENLLKKYELDQVLRCIENATICQGLCTVTWEDPQLLNDLLEGKAESKKVESLTCKLVFISLQDIMTLLAEEAKAQGIDLNNISEIAAKNNSSK